ncbi:RecQ family zinc-binding domain-containing protein [Streptomyces sp. NPDC002130]|uniref:RecQ family zinc-binding domain-containing protein n=1 Tax=Streptomyces sp. NPDC002130 TaxID=3155568 RepID=UPI003320D261
MSWNSCGNWVPLERRRRVDRSRIEMMRGHAETPTCRRRYLLGYFGEQLDDPCGRCDVCDREDDLPVTGAGHRDSPPPPGNGGPYETNDRVRHAEWGAGTVMRTEEDRLVVLFEKVGYKTLSLTAVQEGDLLTGT